MLVYSTNPDVNIGAPSQQEPETLSNAAQKLIVAIDRRNRGGKTVTLIKGFVGKEEDLLTLSKTLKTKCGVGGSAKDGEIIIQGDFREKIVSLLTGMGYGAKRGN